MEQDGKGESEIRSFSLSTLLTSLPLLAYLLHLPHLNARPPVRVLH